MISKEKVTFSTTQLAVVLEKIPVGITIIDREGHILYYNEYCSQYVDRKPEYIGKDIRFCHQKKESIEKIDRIIAELIESKKNEFYYEVERNGKKLGVTVSPFEVNGELIGFIQSFVVRR